jgi:hypothetical protein
MQYCNSFGDDWRRRECGKWCQQRPYVICCSLEQVESTWYSIWSNSTAWHTQAITMVTFIPRAWLLKFIHVLEKPQMPLQEEAVEFVIALALLSEQCRWDVICDSECRADVWARTHVYDSLRKHTPSIVNSALLLAVHWMMIRQGDGLSRDLLCIVLYFVLFLGYHSEARKIS